MTNKPFTAILIILFFLSILLLPYLIANCGNINQINKQILNFLNSIEAKETHLFQSYTNTAHSIETPNGKNFINTEKGYLDDTAFTYDQALAVMVLIKAGKYEKAKKILSIFADNFISEKNGNYGLFTSYKLSHFDYFIPTPSGKKNLLCMGIDGDRIHTGPNVWVGLCYLQYFKYTNDPVFIPPALKLFKWECSLNHYKMPDGSKGGVAMGYGWGPDWENVYSTENNFDYYAFIEGLIKIYNLNKENVLNIFKNEKVSLNKLKKEKQNILNWIIKIGYNKEGYINRGANPKNNPDTTKALDCASWFILALMPETIEKEGINIQQIIATAEKDFLVEVSDEKNKFKGFDYTNIKGFAGKRKKRVIWFEGTAQMALAYKITADYFKQKNNKKLYKRYYKKYKFFINELNRFSKTYNIEYSALPITFPIISKDVMSYAFSEWWPIVRSNTGYSISLSSTCWKYFAVIGFNPFELKFE